VTHIALLDKKKVVLNTYWMKLPVGSTELRPIAYIRCGRCRIPNPYNILAEGEIRRIFYVLFFLPFSNFVLCFHFPIPYDF
jgi:hypothetical protein